MLCPAESVLPLIAFTLVTILCIIQFILFCPAENVSLFIGFAGINISVFSFIICPLRKYSFYGLCERNNILVYFHLLSFALLIKYYRLQALQAFKHFCSLSYYILPS